MARAVGAERVTVAASGFTTLWALTWLSAESVALNAAVNSGLAVGSVMAGSGLAVLWWKTRTLRQLDTEGGASSENAEIQDER